MFHFFPSKVLYIILHSSPLDIIQTSTYVFALNFGLNDVVKCPDERHMK